MKTKMNLSWSGTLTHENVNDVARLLILLLKGEQYTTVVSYEYKNYRPEVRTCQKLKNGPGIVSDFSKESNFSYIHMNDSYGVYSFNTSVKDEKCSDFASPYFVFDVNKVTITMRTNAGSLSYVVFMVEDKEGHPCH